MRQPDVEGDLREQIPLSAGMGVRVLEASPECVKLEAPLEPNMNHHETAFGGSVAALAILAGWTLVSLRLGSEGFETHTVIQESTVRYERPVHGSFRAVCRGADEESWERFRRALVRRGKGRVRLSVEVESEGETAAIFAGAYVAIAENGRATTD